MASMKTSTVTEQAAAHLREELRKGRWTGLMPGRRTLARELGVSHNTVQEALNLLEGENILLPQGIGRRRQIAKSTSPARRALRVGILLYEVADRKLDYTVDLRHELEAAGHIAMFAPKGLVDLGMDVKRVAKLVGQTAADAWVVCAASGEVLEWFAGQERPVFAMFGRRRDIRIAGTGPDKLSALKKSLRHLVGLGHRRIVMLAREERRKPVPGQAEQAFLDELEALGIPTGPYHLPDWEGHPEGLRHCLDALFLHTPPTALIVQEAQVFIAVQQHLANRGIVAPRDVSLICGDQDEAFAWCHPVISHISWDSAAIPRRIKRWVDHVARGQDDRRQTFTRAEYVHGGTVGPVPETVQR
jgi:DNA-binding LacI/PurR family transcriptional regulator